MDASLAGRARSWRKNCLRGNTQRDQGHESRDQEGKVEGAPGKAYSMSKGDRGKERRGTLVTPELARLCHARGICGQYVWAGNVNLRQAPCTWPQAKKVEPSPVQGLPHP